jgi:hypothetical protein
LGKGVSATQIHRLPGQRPFLGSRYERLSGMLPVRLHDLTQGVDGDYNNAHAGVVLWSVSH